MLVPPDTLVKVPPFIDLYKATYICLPLALVSTRKDALIKILLEAAVGVMVADKLLATKLAVVKLFSVVDVPCTT